MGNNNRTRFIPLFRLLAVIMFAGASGSCGETSLIDAAGFNTWKITATWSDYQTTQVGYTVALSNQNFIAGDPTDGLSGAVWIVSSPYTSYYDTDEMNPFSASSDEFGRSVAKAGDIIAGGALNDDGTGAVFVNSGSYSWQSLSSAIVGDDFGNAIDVYGTYLAIGAKADPENGTDAGAAYVYVMETVDNWTMQQKLTADDGAVNDNFGASISIDGNYVVVGAPGHGTGGAAYVFYRSGSTWTQQAKLDDAGTGVGDNFGFSVSIDDIYVAVGAYGFDGVGADSGMVYVFRRNESVWTLYDTVTGSDTDENDQFGYSVAISDRKLIVGAPQDDPNGAFSGSVYFFVKSSGFFVFGGEQKYYPPGGQTNDQFGYCVDIDTGKAAVGVPGSEEIVILDYLEFDFE